MPTDCVFEEMYERFCREAAVPGDPSKNDKVTRAVPAGIAADGAAEGEALAPGRGTTTTPGRVTLLPPPLQPTSVAVKTSQAR